jgi:hypothetical protein
LYAQEGKNIEKPRTKLGVAMCIAPVIGFGLFMGNQMIRRQHQQQSVVAMERRHLQPGLPNPECMAKKMTSIA